MKKTIILASIISFTVIVVVILNFMYQGGLFNRREETPKNYVSTTTIKKSTTTEEIRIIVEIKGAVKYPGVYVFDHSPVLVYEVIDMAGGLTSVANTSDINLAMALESNESITISSNSSAKSYVSKIGEGRGKVNINTANKETLKTIPGIGDSKAVNIINYRKTNGFFKSIEDIKKVDGIGESIFESIKDYITV